MPLLLLSLVVLCVKGGRNYYGTSVLFLVFAVVGFLVVSNWAAKGFLELPTTAATDYKTVGDVLVMGDTTLRVPYTLLADNLQVVATATEGIQVIVVPDPDNPRKGWLEITAGGITTGSSKVEVTISGQFKSHTHSLELEKEWLKPDPETQNKTLQFDESFDETHPLTFTYVTNTPGIVTIPDSSSTWVRLLYASSKADGHTRDTIQVAINPNMEVRLRRTGITVTNRVSTDILTFLIVQDYNSTVIDFADSGLGSYLVATEKRPVVDVNRDKVISMAEAALVPSLGTLFDTGSNTGRSYTSFNEFQYFTGITKLTDGNFNHWTNLEEITFPESLTSIESGNGDEAGILTDCPKLTTIQGKFSVDGRAVVYNKTLLAVATGDDTSYSIPDGVTRLGSRSVYGVRELGVPASVTNIVNSALADTSRVDRDTLYIYFKGVTPPQCEDHPLGNDGEIDNCHPVKVLVPAVIIDGSVDVTKTKARIEEFKTAFGSNAARMKFSYYTDWPFDEGIHLTATLARKQAYTCDAIPKDSIPGIWMKNEHIAVLYELGGVRKRADARITAVRPGGEATIRFTVDENAPEDLACTLVYPLSAAREDNTGAISYGEMASNPQDGTPDGCFDVHVGSATFHTTNSVQTGKVKISPIYAIFKLSLASAIDADHPLTVKDNAGNVITTVKPKTGIDLAYVAMPVTASTGKYYKFAASTADNKFISLSDNFVIEKGKAYPANVDQYNGHKYVDLGLPSGLKWATCNVGATKPEECGDYFAWGETTPKHNYVWGTYKFNPGGDGKTFTKYTTGKKTVLDAEDDAATANWGASWRMPTNAEWTELLENCTIQYESRPRPGVDVFRITSKNNSATIFLPAAGQKRGSIRGYFNERGCYWSSSLSNDSSAKGIEFDKIAVPTNIAAMNLYHRCYGLTVRPVCD